MEPLSRLDTAALFLPLHEKLVALLRGLTPDQWRSPTVCKGWNVHDLAAHLLDTALRRLSSGRDQHFSPPAQPITDHASLVAYINQLNDDWVRAMRRISPPILVDLMEAYGRQSAALIASLDPDAAARFPVSWAGESESKNWFDVAREYTERWHHQQQIRDAVSAAPLRQREWLHPALATFVRALPVTYRDVPGDAGTHIVLDITGEAGGVWTLRKSHAEWTLHEGRPASANATVVTDDDTAWRIFTKGLTADVARPRVNFSGDAALCEPFLHSLAIVA